MDITLNYLLGIRGRIFAIHFIYVFKRLPITVSHIKPSLHFAVPSYPKVTSPKLLYTNNSRFHLISADAPVKFFDDQVMRDAKVIDVSPDGRASFEIRITPYYGNINGVLHGGAAGVIFDMLTTPALAPLSRPDYWEYVYNNPGCFCSRALTPPRKNEHGSLQYTDANPALVSSVA